MPQRSTDGCLINLHVLICQDLNVLLEMMSVHHPPCLWTLAPHKTHDLCLTVFLPPTVMMLHLPSASPLPIPVKGSMFTSQHRVQIGRVMGFSSCAEGEEVMPSSLHGAASGMNI